MNKRTQQAIETLKAGGYFRKALETQYRGGEKFVTRLHSADGLIVSGVGIKTFYEVQSQLIVRDCFSGSTFPTEWKIAA